MRHYNTEHSQHFYPRPCCVYLADYFALTQIQMVEGWKGGM